MMKRSNQKRVIKAIMPAILRKLLATKKATLMTN